MNLLPTLQNRKQVVRAVILLTILLSPVLVAAQNLKGIWSGDLLSDTTGVPILNTQYVLNVKEQHENTISGRAYVLERRYDFEGVLDFVGIINKDQVKIMELRIVSSKVPVDVHHLCIKNLSLKLSQGEKADHLQGPWTGMQVDGPCIPGIAVLKKQKAGEALNIPASFLNKVVTDVAPGGFLNTRLSKPTIIDVKSNVLDLEISDYRREDNDTVSIFVNRRPFIRRLKVERKPHTRTLRIDTKVGLTEMILLAENLGQIPPNTSVLMVSDGYQKQRVMIESTKEISAVIYFRYNPPTK